MNNQELHWRHAAGLGVLGGLCLVLLKLMQAGFYLDDIFSKTALVAYLTYACFLLFGAIAGVLFTEQNEKKNAFITGLLAPSILLTFFSAPSFRLEGIGDSPRDIKRLSIGILPSAYAQEGSKNPSQEGKGIHLVSTVTEIRKIDVEPSIKEALLSALGQPQPTNTYLFVIGKTQDGTKAAATAASINEFLKAAKAEKRGEYPLARILRIEGSSDFYVALGALQGSNSVLATKKQAYGAAVNAWGEHSDPRTARAAPLLLEGRIVDARDIFEKR